MNAARTAHLQSEIDRIADTLNVPSRTVKVGVLLTNDDYNVFIDDGGKYHYSYFERGQQRFDRVGELDDVLYWFAEGLTQDIGSHYAAQHTALDHDFRSVMWARQYELLSGLNPDWASRRVRELADYLRSWGLDRDVELLPNIPERDG
jgi:hypothetical protein